MIVLSSMSAGSQVPYFCFFLKHISALAFFLSQFSTPAVVSFYSIARANAEN